MTDRHETRGGIPPQDDQEHRRRFPFKIRIRRVAFEQIDLIPQTSDNTRGFCFEDDGSTSDAERQHHQRRPAPAPEPAPAPAPAAEDAANEQQSDNNDRKVPECSRSVELQRHESNIIFAPETSLAQPTIRRLDVAVPVADVRQHLPTLTLLIPKNSCRSTFQDNFESLEQVRKGRSEQFVSAMRKRPRLAIECSAADTPHPQAMATLMKQRRCNDPEMPTMTEMLPRMTDELDQLDDASVISVPTAILDPLVYSDVEDCHVPDINHVTIESPTPSKFIVDQLVDHRSYTQIDVSPEVHLAVPRRLLEEFRVPDVEEAPPQCCDATSIMIVPRTLELEEMPDAIEEPPDQAGRSPSSQHQSEEPDQFQLEIETSDDFETTTAGLLDTWLEEAVANPILEDLSYSSITQPDCSDWPLDLRILPPNVDECDVVVISSDDDQRVEDDIGVGSSESTQVPVPIRDIRDEQMVPRELDLEATSSLPVPGYDFEDLYVAELDKAAQEITAKIESFILSEMKHQSPVNVERHGLIKSSDDGSKTISRHSTIRLGLSRKQPVQPLHSLKRLDDDA